MPAVAVFLGASLAALMLFGVNVFNQGLQGMLKSIPLIGGALAKTISWDASIVGYFWNLVHPHTAGVNQSIGTHATEHWLNVQAHATTSDALQTLQVKTIPQAVAAGVGPVESALADLNHGVVMIAGQQNAWDAQTTAELGRISTETGTILPQQIAQLRGQVASDMTTIQGAIASGQAQTEREIAAAGQTAAAQGQAGAVAQLAPAIGSIQTQVGALAGQIATVGGIGLTGVATLAQSLVGRIANVEECTAGICSSGSGSTLGGLGKILQQLAPLVDDGILFALVAAAATDPGGVATEVESVLSPIAGAAQSAFSTLTGVAG